MDNFLIMGAFLLGFVAAAVSVGLAAYFMRERLMSRITELEAAIKGHRRSLVQGGISGDANSELWGKIDRDQELLNWLYKE